MSQNAEASSADARPARVRSDHAPRAGGGRRAYGGYVLRRLVNSVFVVLGAYTLAFFILFLLPSDPVAIMLDGNGNGLYVEPEQLAQLREKYNLDRSVVEQYLIQLFSAVRGDIGHSIQFNEPVAGLILKALPATLPLALLAGLVALIAGSAVALAAQGAQAGWLRTFFESLPALGASVPVFWVGLLLLQLFAFRYPIFPPIGNDGFRSLVLPALALSVPSAAAIAQVFSASLSVALAQPYCKYAKAKGCSHRQVLIRYAAKNALPPVIGILGVTTGGLLTGSVVTETVFTREGLGRLTENAVTFQDIPVVQGIVLFCALVFVAVTLIADLIVLALDPRVSLDARGKRS